MHSALKGAEGAISIDVCKTFWDWFPEGPAGGFLGIESAGKRSKGHTNMHICWADVAPLFPGPPGLGLVCLGIGTARRCVLRRGTTCCVGMIWVHVLDTGRRFGRPLERILGCFLDLFCCQGFYLLGTLTF